MIVKLKTLEVLFKEGWYYNKTYDEYTNNGDVTILPDMLKFLGKEIEIIPDTAEEDLFVIIKKYSPDNRYIVDSMIEEYITRDS